VEGLHHVAELATKGANHDPHSGYHCVANEPNPKWCNNT